MDTAIRKKIETFYSAFPARTWPKGQIIIHAFDTPKGVYFIEKGSVRQYAINANGDQVVVNVYRNPAFMPMSSAINDSDSEYFYETVEDSVLRCAPHADALDFIKNNPDVAFDLLARLYSGLDGVLMRMVHLMSSSAYVRILHELVIQAKRQADSQRENSVLLPLKEYELGMYCGLTKETVSREFKKLKAKQLAQVSSQGIKIISLKKLESELSDYE